MALPTSVLKQLVRELDALIRVVDGGSVSRDGTLPLSPAIVARYSVALDEAAIALRDLVQLAVPTEYLAIKARVREITHAADHIFGVLVSVSSFQAFHDQVAVPGIPWLSDVLHRASADISPGSESSVPAGYAAWTFRPTLGVEDPLAVVFDLPSEPLTSGGDFAPDRVFSRFSYNHPAHRAQIGPHLSSVGLSAIDDLLVSTCVVGWIVGAPDPVLARRVLVSILNLTLDPSRKSVVTETLTLARSRENASDQSRRRVLSALQSLPAVRSAEERAHIVADVHRRVVEGPVRHWGWVLRCLIANNWQPVPGLTPVRDGMRASSEWLRAIADGAILTQLRNGQAHETLEWDGATGTFFAEGERVDPSDVDTAIEIGTSFDRGCESALAVTRFILARNGRTEPAEGEMPQWLRAVEVFGENGLHVDSLELVPGALQVVLGHWDLRGINPCMQTLLHLRSRVPQMDEYRVSVLGAPHASTVVSGRAIDLTVPMWNFTRIAYSTGVFAALPLATFLPINFDARRRDESALIAVRSVSWICVDDVLDAVEEILSGFAPLDRLKAKIALALMSLEACAADAPIVAVTRLTRTQATLHELDRDLSSFTLPSDAIDHLPSVKKLRASWEAWGPVSRLPGLPLS